MPPLLDNDPSEVGYPKSKSPKRISENKKRKHNTDELSYYMVTSVPKGAIRIPTPGVRPQNTLYKPQTKPNHSPNQSNYNGPGFERRPSSRHSHSRPSSSNGPDTNPWEGGVFHQQEQSKQESKQNPSKNKEMVVSFVESQVDNDNNGNQPDEVLEKTPAISTKDSSPSKMAKQTQNLAERRRKHSSQMISLTGPKNTGMDIDPDLRSQKMRYKKEVTNSLKSDQDPVKTTFTGNNVSKRRASQGRLAISLKEALRWPIHDAKSDTKTLLLHDSGTTPDTQGRLSLYVDSNHKSEVFNCSKPGYKVYVTDRDLISIKYQNRENEFQMDRWFFIVEQKEQMKELREYFGQFDSKVLKVVDVNYDSLVNGRDQEMIYAKNKHPHPTSSSHPTHKYHSGDISSGHNIHDQNLERQNRNHASKREQLGLAKRETEHRPSTRLSNGSQNPPITPFETSGRRTRSSASKVETPRPQTVPRRRPRQKWTEDLRFPFELDQRGATINENDLTKLDDDEFLNDEIVNFCLHYMLANVDSDLRAKIHLFNTFFFEKFAKPGGEGEKFNYSGVERWTNKLDLFSKDYVIIPINEQLHWYLALICNLPQLAEKCSKSSSDIVENIPFCDQASASPGNRKSPRTSGFETTDLTSNTMKHSPPPKTQKPDDERITCIIIFDSLGNARKRTMEFLKGYIIKEAKSKRNLTINMKDMRGINAKVPQQENYSDCGLYLLHYVKKFLSRPEILKDIVSERQSRNPEGLRQMWNPSSHEMREELFSELVDLKKKHTEYLKASEKDSSTSNKEQTTPSKAAENRKDDEISKDEGNDSLQILTTPPSSNAKNSKYSVLEESPTAEKLSLSPTARHPGDLSTDTISTPQEFHKEETSLKPDDTQSEQAVIFSDKMDVDDDMAASDTAERETDDVEMADESDVDLVVQHGVASNNNDGGSTEKSPVHPRSAKNTKAAFHVEIPTNSLSPAQRKTYIIPQFTEAKRNREVIEQSKEQDRGSAHETLSPEEMVQDLTVADSGSRATLSNRKSAARRPKIPAPEIPESPQTETVYETDVSSENEMPIDRESSVHEGNYKSRDHTQEKILTADTKPELAESHSKGNEVLHNGRSSYPSSTDHERDEWHIVDRDKDVYDTPSSPTDEASKEAHQGNEPLENQAQYQSNKTVRDKQKRPASADASLPSPQPKRQRSLPPEQPQVPRQEPEVVNLIDDDDEDDDVRDG